MISKHLFVIAHTLELKEDMDMLNTTKKTLLVLTLALTPVTAFAQTTDTTTPATTSAAGTTDTTSTQDNNRTDYSWLGLLGLAGLAGLRRQAPVVTTDRTSRT